MDPSTYKLRSEVSLDSSNIKTTYTFPYDTSVAQNFVKAFYDALWSLSTVATEDETTPFFDTKESLTTPLKSAYDYETDEFDPWWRPEISEIYENFENESIPPMTFTIRKTKNEIEYVYESGFIATDHTLTIDIGRESHISEQSIKHCGQGVLDTHAPYALSKTNTWRYGPSIISLSIQKNGNQLHLGVTSTPPQEPIWYRFWEPMAMTTYTKPTFDIDSQATPVQYVFQQSD